MKQKRILIRDNSSNKKKDNGYQLSDIILGHNNNNKNLS